jgi:hypothetical protein
MDEIGRCHQLDHPVEALDIEAVSDPAERSL